MLDCCTIKVPMATTLSGGIATDSNCRNSHSLSNDTRLPPTPDGWTITLVRARWTRGPLVPVMLTLYVPGVVPLLGEKVRLKAPVPPENNWTLVETGLIGRPRGDEISETVTLP